MRDKSNFKSVITTGIILFLITGIAALILGFVNDVTAPMIKKNEEAKQSAAMTAVMPEAESFKRVESGYAKNEKVADVFGAVIGEETIGYAVIVEPNGYGGAISMVVGVTKDGVVTGVDITSQSETAGLGANCTKDEFRNQFKGKTEGITVVKNGAKDNQIDAMTSATVTSKAVTEGVNLAIETVKSIEGGNE